MMNYVVRGVARVYNCLVIIRNAFKWRDFFVDW